VSGRYTRLPALGPPQDTPEYHLRAALAALGPLSRYVRVEAQDLEAYMMQVRHVVGLTGHEYDIDGRQEWHSGNCLYRKMWAMGLDDEPYCIAARALLGL
jgi:hypothetical protein